ncbi:MAG: TonB-dependent receptor [Sphingobacteriales bacterium]|nr:TonB-dependent receptor [Sphingobacteriales bacterium]
MKKQLLLLASLIPVLAFAQNPETPKNNIPDSLTTKIFHLGEVVITASHKDEMTGRITKQRMEAQNKFEVSRTLNMLPGINLTASGQRNESMVSVRGFDLRAIPVYMDGLPVYLTYDGLVDLARFTTFDLATIDVSKGFSSMLYGPNSLGGAINLISRKPVKKLDYDGAIGMINKNGFRGNINIGSNFNKFYFQGGYSYLHRDSYKMSNDFKPRAHENGGERENSYRTDQKINLKLGWTPNKNHEYVLGYINQQGEKGTPVYAGDDKSNSLYSKPRYWQWPNWDKETYYFLSNTKLGAKDYIKSRIYYDIFKNSLNSYDDSTYTTQTKPYAFQSWYNDYTYGGSIEYGTTIIPKNELKLAAHFKEDIHRENNLNEPVRRIEDNTINISLEDVFRINEKFILIPGIGYNARKNIVAQDYNSNSGTISDYPEAGTSTALNGQLGIFYYFKKNHKLSATASRKTRFATIKDRYSYRMGTAIPNPELKPETADNYDLTYESKFFKKLSFQTSLFYSHVTDAILSVSNIQPGKSQMQNTGSAEFMGVEMAVKYDILENILMGANYSYIERHNLTNPNVLFTDVPYTKVCSYLQYKPIKQIRIMLNAEYNSLRYSTSYGTKAPEFTVFNTMIAGQVWKYISVEAGVNNIFDKNYMLTEGYPEEGMNFFMTLRFFNYN